MLVPAASHLSLCLASSSTFKRRISERSYVYRRTVLWTLRTMAAPAPAQSLQLSVFSAPRSTGSPDPGRMRIARNTNTHTATKTQVVIVVLFEAHSERACPRESKRNKFSRWKLSRPPQNFQAQTPMSVVTLGRQSQADIASRHPYVACVLFLFMNRIMIDRFADRFAHDVSQPRPVEHTRLLATL